MCWEAEESLVVGFERVALCHSRLLDDMMDGQGDKGLLERLKQEIDTLVGDCSVRQLSDVLVEGVERMMVGVEEGEREGGMVDRVMGAMADGLKDMISSLEVLKNRMDDCGVDVEGDGVGWGVGVLRDVSMADCLVENTSLMVCGICNVQMDTLSCKLYIQIL